MIEGYFKEAISFLDPISGLFLVSFLDHFVDPKQLKSYTWNTWPAPPPLPKPLPLLTKVRWAVAA